MNLAAPAVGKIFTLSKKNDSPYCCDGFSGSNWRGIMYIPREFCCQEFLQAGQSKNMDMDMTGNDLKWIWPAEMAWIWTAMIWKDMDMTRWNDMFNNNPKNPFQTGIKEISVKYCKGEEI